MKRRTKRWQISQAKAAAKRRKRALRKRPRYKGGVERTITAPSELSFTRNGARTIAYLERLKTLTLLENTEKVKGKQAKRRYFIDLAKIRRISVPAAVVLSAELHRISLSASAGHLTVRNHKAWNHRVRALLSDLGSIELLGSRKRVAPLGRNADEIFLLPLCSGEKSDGERLYKLQEELADTIELFSPKLYLAEGLGEAASNCIEHAYLNDDFPPRFPYAGHRWWASACYDPVTASLRFFIYDQGTGIPQSLRNKPGWWDAVTALLDRTGLGTSEADVIERAFEVGRSRTRTDGRGKGLKQMYDAIKRAGDGYIRIVSGKGDFTLDYEGGTRKSNHSTHIGGTLVEWSIPLTALAGGKIA